MQDEFKALADSFARYAPSVPAMPDDAWAALVPQLQVVILAGGESKRLRGVMHTGYNKVSMPLPNGDTLLEYNIRMYRDAGIRTIVLLIAHASESVKNLIGDGSVLGVSVTYCEEPEKPLAKGGAIRNALEVGALDESKYMIVHNAGDIFFGYPGSLPREFVSQHVAFERAGSVATIVTAPMSLVQGSALKIQDGYVSSIAFEPYVPVPYHTAVTVCSPSIYSHVRRLFPLGEKLEFESVLFPDLASQHILTATKVDNQYSLQVKNEKQWEQLLKLFSPPAV